MSFVEAIAQTLVEVAKDDLEPGRQYLMVDSEHAIVVECKDTSKILFTLQAVPSFMTGFHAVTSGPFCLYHSDVLRVKFFQLPG